MKTTVDRGQECWHVSTPTIDASITVRGGMMAPVSFRLPGGVVVQPYYVSPWQDDTGAAESARAMAPAVLIPLRGDFFCLPFGGANKVGAEDHQPHGESSWKPWTFVSCGADVSGQGPAVGSPDSRGAAGGTAGGSSPATRLKLSMDYAACTGSIQKTLYFGWDKAYIGTEHLLSGFSGSYPLGHHAILAGSTECDGIWRLCFPPFELGLTDPDNTLPFRGGEYYALAEGAEFQDFAKVPTRWKHPASTDLSLFPDRRGFIDIAAIYRRPEASGSSSAVGHGAGGHGAGGKSSGEGAGWVGRVGWTVAVNRHEGYLWYSLKDQSLLPATVFWMENQGRHGSPWSGRNSCIGIEETCTYMAAGRARSMEPNPVSQHGIPTTVRLSPATTLRVRTIQGVLPVPSPDIRVAGLRLDSTGCAVLVTDTGHEMALPVSPAWVLD